MFHSYYIIVIIIFIITTIIWKTNNQMKADVKLNKLAKLQLHMLNVRQTTALTVRHYANVILWLKFLPMGLKGLKTKCKLHILNYLVLYAINTVLLYKNGPLLYAITCFLGAICYKKQGVAAICYNHF